MAVEDSIFEQEVSDDNVTVVEDGLLDNISTEEESAPSEVEAEEQEAQPEPEATSEEPEATETDEPENTSTAPSEEPEEEEDDTSFYSNYSKEVGLELNSDEDITSALKEYASLKSQANPLEDPEIKALYEFKKSGGDTTQFHSLKAKNFDSLNTKDLLKEKYFLDKKSLVAENSKLAERRFERDYQSKYKLLDEMSSLEGEDLEEFKAEHGQEIEDLQLELDYEAKEAKADLAKWQQEATTPPQPEEEQLTPEQIDEIVQEFEGKVKTALENFNELQVSIGDKSDPFKIGFNDDELSEIADNIKNPNQFVEKYLGLKDGQVNPDVMKQTVAKLIKFEQIGQHLSDYILEQRNLETIEGRVANPNKPTDVSYEREKSELDDLLTAKQVPRR